MFLKIFKKNKSPVFIIGAPRSGTTWLWGLLTSFSNIVPLLKEDFEPTIKISHNGKFKTSETGAFINYDNTTIKKVIEEKQKKFPNKILIEKTPLHILHIDKILKLFPNAKIIYIQRDPRAVISSMIHSTFFNFANSLDDAIKKYKQYMDAIYPFLSHPNIHCIKYEDLHTNATKEIEKILRFLKVTTSQVEIDNAISENNNKTKVVIKGAFRKGSIDSYKEDLTKEQITLIENHLRNIIDTYNYN